MIIIISTFLFDDYSPNLKKKQNWMHYYFSFERKIVFFLHLAYVYHELTIKYEYKKLIFFFFKIWINLQRIEKSCSGMNRCQCVHEPVLLRSLLKKTNWTPVGDKVSSNYDLIGWLYTFIYFAGLNIFLSLYKVDCAALIKFRLFLHWLFFFNLLQLKGYFVTLDTLLHFRYFCHYTTREYVS